ncbi:MAG TPA: hypothetical protein PLO52_14105, partial [Flavobacterium alvei]|nr:hypothetical protein [Flavobacterium alvei]
VNLRFFNRENDISYIGEGIGYTQGVGISYEVDFDTFKELANKIFKNTKIDKAPNSGVIDHDSNFAPEKSDPSKSNKPNSKVLNPNSEGRAPEED